VTSPNHARLRNAITASRSVNAPGWSSPAAWRARCAALGTNPRRYGAAANSAAAIARPGRASSSPPRRPKATTSGVATTGPSAKPRLPPIENADIPLARLAPLAYAANFDPSGW
jgi:hypothetical protein